LDISSPNQLIFKTQAEVKAFARWYLGTSPDEAQSEFETTQQRDEYFERRYDRLVIAVDDLRDLKFTSPTKTAYKDQVIFKLAKEFHEPLSSIGSDLKSSRFNYKESPLFKNRAVYFGHDNHCCYAEIFHSDFMRRFYADLGSRPDELARPRYFLYEYEINLENLLVLTSAPTFKGLGINQSVLKDEWYDLNFEFDVPSSSQILAAIVRAQGYKGILYSSVRSQIKTNLVIFEENTGDLKNLGFKLKNRTEFNLEEYEKSQGLRK
jgi:hypothetical protein